MLAKLHARGVLRKPVSLVSSLIIATGLLTTGAVLVTPSAASAATQITICLTYASSYCADVKDGYNVSGQPIWLYANGRDDHWYLITGVTCIAGSNCYEFEDAQRPSLCLSATTHNRNIVLGACNGGLGSWYPEGGGYLGNGAYGANYTLMVRSDVDGTLLQALPAGTTGYWKRWAL
jgi:hypothetical protein